MRYIDAANISVTNLGHEMIFNNQPMINISISSKIKKKTKGTTLPTGTMILLEENNHVGNWQKPVI